MDEVPAPQIFSSWSKGLEVNLVVSNLYKPPSGELGSGIFHASQDRNPTYTYDADVSDPLVMMDEITTTVSGDMMMDFNESQEIMIKKRVKALMKVLKFVNSAIDDDGEDDGLFIEDGITYENVGRTVEEFIESVKLNSLKKEKVDRFLRNLLRDQRRIVEWDRYRNRLACSDICHRVRQLIKQSRQRALDISDENENSQQELSSSDVFNFTDRDREVFNYHTVPSDLTSKTYQYIIHENISFYSYQTLEINESPFPNRTKRVKVCHLDTFCCEVEYLYPHENNPVGGPNYSLLVYNGTVAKGSGVYEMWTQVCGVVFCTERDINSCTPLDAPQPELNTTFRLRSIQGQFDTKFIYPSVFSLNFSLINNELWSYADSSNETDWNSVLSINGDIPNLLTAALFGRWYSLDP